MQSSHKRTELGSRDFLLPKAALYLYVVLLGDVYVFFSDISKNIHFELWSIIQKKNKIWLDNYFMLVECIL